MTKLYTLADICMVPLGTSDPSVSSYVAKIEKRILASDLKSTVHSFGTTIEGPWDEVMALIGELHEYSHDELGHKRIHTEIRLGTRVDKSQTAVEKLESLKDKMKHIMD
ncbi:Ecm15p Ecym_5296 [Eremothecium cymbalariae DBVPG|uniref:Thiamine-binding protein domain-containing protein n=1 Tax=Eremothecium cymbalariae (strain CBS 270.75 / DBVPG 7215 / KCTC 17166 / NRRL Y-17582) TaxID=931890 RepID=I6NDB6_ERECY|nr:hypothetical protein Ecym_5296 [Eremothecium cymbalariae DBVPG\